MNYRQEILDIVAGKKGAGPVFVPRLDLWYSANRQAGTLPAKYARAELRDICDDMGFGYHAIIPNYLNLDDEQGDWDIGLGFYHLKSHCYKVMLHNVGRATEKRNGCTYTTYDTPKGKISTMGVLDDNMLKNGINFYALRNLAIKSEADYEAVAYIYKNIEIQPRYEVLEAQREFLGDRSPLIGFAGLHAGAMHLLIKELMQVDTFYVGMALDKEALEQLAAEIEPLLDRLFDIVANAPVDMILYGANYDVSLTAPSMFEEYIMPKLQEKSRLAHDKGKYLITHADGENFGLMPHLTRSGFDVADSACPAPLTKIPFDACYRDFSQNGITIWGGIPSTTMLEEIMSDNDFDKYLDYVFSSLGNGDRIIFSIADTTPPAAKWERIVKVAKRTEEFRNSKRY